MKLTRSEASSALWAKLEEHFTARLAEKRAENDHMNKDAIQTAYLRGQLASIKELLALADVSAPEPETDEPE